MSSLFTESDSTLKIKLEVVDPTTTSDDQNGKDAADDTVPLTSHRENENTTAAGITVSAGGGRRQQEQEAVNLPELQDQVTESNYIHSSDHWFNGCEYKCQVGGHNILLF